MKSAAEPSNRKLIRPSLNDVKQPVQPKRQEQPPPNGPRPKRSAPPEHTSAESFYYVKQMQNRTPMVLVLRDGEELHGLIDWYDKACLKLSREDGPNLLVYKENIKYLYKANSGGAAAESAPKKTERRAASRTNGRAATRSNGRGASRANGKASAGPPEE